MDTTAPTVLATVEPLRRYVRSLVRDPHDVDDIVQETVTRMLARADRLEESAATGYSFVVARNLIRSGYRRQVRQRDHLHLLVDDEPAERPDELAVRREERAALREALTRLAPDQRRELLDHVVADRPLAALADDGGEGAVAARLARTRARVRVDYLLSLRRVELLSPRCRPVLLSLSSGDRRRQKVPRSGNHLVACEVCADLAPPLMERRRALAGFVPLPLAALHGKLAGLLRVHPAASGSAAAGVAASAAVAVVVLTGGSSNPPASAAPAPPRSDLSDARGALLPRRAT